MVAAQVQQLLLTTIVTTAIGGKLQLLNNAEEQGHILFGTESMGASLTACSAGERPSCGSAPAPAVSFYGPASFVANASDVLSLTAYFINMPTTCATVVNQRESNSQPPAPRAHADQEIQFAYLPAGKHHGNAVRKLAPPLPASFLL